MKPDLEAVAAGFDDVDLVVIDASVDPEFAAALGVLGTPTLLAVRDGAEVARFTGRRTRRELQVMFTEVDAGTAVTVARIGAGDRVVWTLGGAGLVAVGLLTGPIWPLVALGAGVAGYANYPGNRSAM